MNGDSVYLCGGMENISLEDMRGWREEAKVSLESSGIKTLDPTRRMALHLQSTTQEGHSKNRASKIVKLDYADIAKSTVILADLRDSSKGGRRWGSVAELAHAHTKNKIIIVILDKEQFVHPFIEFFATEIHYTLEDAVEAVKEYYW